MLRFDPGFGRVRNARQFQVWEGGGEYNVARAMRKCWGKRASGRHRAAEERSGLAGGGLHLPGRRGHIARHLARFRRHRPQHARRPQLHREGLRHPRGAGLLGPRPTRPLRRSGPAKSIGKSCSARKACAGSTPAASSRRSRSNTAEAVIEAVEAARKHGTDRLLRPQLPRLACGRARAARKARRRSTATSRNMSTSCSATRRTSPPAWALRSKAWTSTSRPSIRPTSRR